MAYLYDILTIKGYDVTILKFSLECDKIPEWYCAYVKFKDKIKNEYYNETFRDKEFIIGIDTNHYHNTNQTDEEKLQDCIKQITEVIEEHLEFLEEETNIRDNKMKHITELIKEIGMDKPIGKKYANTDRGVLTRLQGDEVKVVGIAIATLGNGCQEINWIKHKDFMEDEEISNK